MNYFFGLMHELFSRPLGRYFIGQLNLAKLLVKQLRNAGRINIGASVKIRNPHFIKCGKGVAICSYSELIAEQSSNLQRPSIYLGDFVKLGSRCQIHAKSSNIYIGDFASIHNNTYLLGNIYIGRYSILSANIFASSSDHHPFDIPYALIRDQDIEVKNNNHPTNDNPVIIEEDCWIGWGAVIKKGIHIGRGAIVGANTVVTKDVAPYSVVAGQPARKIKDRLKFSPQTTIRANIAEHAPYFYRGFMQLKSERKHLGNNYYCALRNSIIIMPLTSGDISISLQGVTIANGVKLIIECKNFSQEIALPNDKNVEFDITVKLTEINAQKQAICTKTTMPMLSDCSIISIHSSQCGNSKIDHNDNSTLWAISSAALIPT